MNSDSEDRERELSRISDELREAMVQMSPEEQEEAVAALMALAVNGRSTWTIKGMRAEIVEEFPENGRLPIVSHMLDIIDGQLALREMGLRSTY